MESEINTELESEIKAIKIKYGGIIPDDFSGIVEYTNYNFKAWYLNGKLHRVDGPAYEHPNGKKWYLNGELHRVDGPAFEYSSIKTWNLNGIEYSQEEWFEMLSDEQKIEVIWNLR